ncbi:hypothetical protein B0H14DRAFT_3431971 [Mycena olivaceomarginata]|nr:hypothetical protein B0H14DRAFT_3431971 [Mycena olivaceomarginata]
MDEGEWLTTEEEYGRPVSDWPFRAPYGNGYSATSQSLWMYSRERPAPGSKWREPPVPESKDLPLKDPSKGQVPFEDVKGAWARQDKSDAEAVSMGSPSPPPNAAPVPAVPIAPYVTSPPAIRHLPVAPVAPARPPVGYQRPPPGFNLPYHDQGWMDAPMERGANRVSFPDAPRAKQGIFSPVFITPVRVIARTIAKSGPFLCARGSLRTLALDFAISDSGTLPLTLTRLTAIPLHTLRVPSFCQEVQREVKVFDLLLLPLEDKTTASQAEIWVAFILLELEVVLPLSIPLLLPLPLSLPFLFRSQSQRRSCKVHRLRHNPRKKERSRSCPPSYEWRAEESLPGSSLSLLERFNEDIASSSRPLLDRFANTGDVEMPEASVYQRFDVPLEERIGEPKKHCFRKHNQAKKRERKEAEQQAKEEEEWREWEMQQRSGDYGHSTYRGFNS